jgi:hypothetical protein
MLNDPVLSPVLPKYFARQSFNMVGVALAPLEIVKRSKWLTLHPDPWYPARLAIEDQLLVCVYVQYLSR